MLLFAARWLLLLSIFLIEMLMLGSQLRAAEPPPSRPQPPPPLVQQVDATTLKFASPLLKQRFEEFLAQFTMENQRWQIEPLTLKEQSWRRGTYIYTGSWKRALTPDADWKPLSIPSKKPGREFSLTMKPMKTNRLRIESISIGARYVPPGNDWAALTVYNLSAVDGEHDETLRVMFDHNQQHIRELPASRWDFVIPNNNIRAKHRAKGSQIEFIANTINGDTPYTRNILPAIITSQRLRQFELQLCDELEKSLRGDASDQTKVEFINWSHVRSDNPPQQIPLMLDDAPELTDEVKAALIDHGVKQLDRRRQRWREQGDQLHHAVVESFPLLIQWAEEGQKPKPKL